MIKYLRKCLSWFAMFILKMVITALLGFLLALVIALIAGLFLWIHPIEYWYAKPAANYKWRTCVNDYKWDGGGTSCGGPTSYDEALWLVKTKGGQNYDR